MKSIGRKMMYETLQEIVDPKHTALVVWDIHKDFVDTCFNKDSFLANMTSLLAGARKINIPIVYTRITPLPKGYWSPWRLYMLMQREGIKDIEKLQSYMKPGDKGNELQPELSPQPQDLIINKNSLSIFVGTNFESLMKNIGAETLLFTGLRTEIGIDSCARDATSRDFYTMVVEDCTSTIDEELHNCAIRTLKRVCIVESSKNILSAWQDISSANNL